MSSPSTFHEYKQDAVDDPAPGHPAVGRQPNCTPSAQDIVGRACAQNLWPGAAVVVRCKSGASRLFVATAAPLASRISHLSRSLWGERVACQFVAGLMGRRRAGFFVGSQVGITRR